MLCCECKESLLDASKRVYYDETNKDEGVFWCKDCAKTTTYEGKLTKLKGSNLNRMMGNEDEKSSKYLDKLFEEYNNLDCEDAIAGGTIKTRFRYTNVQKQDFGFF